MNICFQADADLNQIIVAATLRIEPSIDFRTAHAANLEGLPDPDVLVIAARDGRLLVSHDRKTMPRFFAEFVASHTSPGLILIPQRFHLPAVVEDLVLIWAASSPKEWMNRISRIPLRSF